MQYTFEKVKENFPKKTYRSQRTLKKMHLGTYARTLINVLIPVKLFDLHQDIMNKCLDLIYELDDNSFVSSTENGFSIIIETNTPTDIESETKQYTNNLLRELSNIEMEFASVDKITVQYGDAYYGEW